MYMPTQAQKFFTGSSFTGKLLHVKHTCVTNVMKLSDTLILPTVTPWFISCLLRISLEEETVKYL